MRPKLLVVVGAVVVCCALLLTGLAGAAAPARTTVTIKAQNGDFSGTVKSPRLRKCADKRKVTLYKQKGRTQRPRTDTKIASDTSELRGSHGVWSTGNTGQRSGKFYARAGRKAGCRAGASKTVRA